MITITDNEYLFNLYVNNDIKKKEEFNTLPYFYCFLENLIAMGRFQRKKVAHIRIAKTMTMHETVATTVAPAIPFIKYVTTK